MERYWNLSHWGVIKTAISGQPFDWSYLLLLEQAKLKEMRNYFKKYGVTEHDNDIRWIDICIKLIDIIRNEDDDDIPYININNYYRFVKIPYGISREKVKEYHIKYPTDLRFCKALHLYYEIRKNYTYEWWD